MRVCTNEERGECCRMSGFKRFERRIGACAGALVAIAAIGGVAANASAATAAKAAKAHKAPAAKKCVAPRSVTVAGIGWTVGLPGDVARLKGFFNKVDKECHTKVGFVTTNSPQPLVAGLLNGTYQFIELSVANTVQAALQGEDIQTVLSTSQGGSGMLDSKNRVGLGEAALKKLGASATIGMISVGGIETLYIDALYSGLHLGYKSLQQIPLGLAGIGPSLTSGKLDIGYGQEEQMQALVVANQAAPILNASGPESEKLTGFLPAAGLMSVPSFTSKYPVLTQDVVTAELKGILWLRANASNAGANSLFKAYPASYRATNTEAGWDSAWQLNRSGFATVTGMINGPALVREARQMQSFGMLKGAFNPSSMGATKYVTSKFVVGAYKALGLKPPSAKDYLDMALLKKMPNY